jgi:cysteine-rich repeat protein
LVSKLRCHLLFVALLVNTSLGCNSLLGNEKRSLGSADGGTGGDFAAAGDGTAGGAGHHTSGGASGGSGVAGNAPMGDAGSAGVSGGDTGGTSGAGGSGGGPAAPCGNGTIDIGETCDDSNVMPGDGCDATCNVEAGWSCDQSQQPICQPKCGDGLVVGSEAKAGGCDDHNNASSDGCGATCQVEAGYVCSGVPSKCAQTCGDGKLDPGETCDDMNAVAGDGCFACAIESGYTCNGAQPSKCTDINECTSGTPCGANSTCANTVGSYTCGCVAGYKLVGSSCADVNECVTGTPCGANSTCTNTPGSFSCGCVTGYSLVGGACTDVNECASGTPCGANSTCANTVGSYSCGCVAGYNMVAGACTDVDECATTAPCGTNAACTNSPGSYACACKAGYTGDGHTCVRTSCAGLAGTECQGIDCCASPTVTGTTTPLSFKLGGPSGTTTATIASFALDKFEVSVGRFRKFVAQYTGHPANGAGAHPLIANSGWQSPTWDNLIEPTKEALAAALVCDPTYATWSTTGTNDLRPINCVSWSQAFAFCAWDGGRLPTEAEWEYAAAGGTNEWTYPWGNTPVPSGAQDSTAAYANYYGLGDGSAGGVYAFADLLAVGTKSASLGKYGQLDLVGSMAEWVLDAYATYPSTCSNCAHLFSLGAYPVIRGGGWDNFTIGTTVRAFPTSQTSVLRDVGFRCARPL